MPKAPICPSCKAGLRVAAKFCDACGLALDGKGGRASICAKCNQPLTIEPDLADFYYCPACHRYTGRDDRSEVA